jgi:4-oxalocrotonate tautomerase family enzyme
LTQLFILEGSRDDQKENSIREVTEPMSSTMDEPKERVRVIIRKMPKLILASVLSLRAN